MKALVPGQVLEHRDKSRTRYGQLDWPLTQTFLEFVEIAIELRSRVANDHN